MGLVPHGFWRLASACQNPFAFVRGALLRIGAASYGRSLVRARQRQPCSSFTPSLAAPLSRPSFTTLLPRPYASPHRTPNNTPTPRPCPRPGALLYGRGEINLVRRSRLLFATPLPLRRSRLLVPRPCLPILHTAYCPRPCLLLALIPTLMRRPVTGVDLARRGAKPPRLAD